MRMMPRATPRHANVHVHLAHADGPNGAGVTSNSVRRTTVESNMKASIFYTWLVKTLHNVLSSFAISLVLFCLLGLGFFCTLHSVSQRHQPSAAFSTRLHKTHTLWRSSRTVLPVLHCQETPFFPVLQSRSRALPARASIIMHVTHESLARECK